MSGAQLGADVFFGALTGAVVGAFIHDQEALGAILEGALVGAVVGALRRKWQPLFEAGSGEGDARVGTIAPYPWYRPSVTYPYSDH